MLITGRSYVMLANEEQKKVLLLQLENEWEAMFWEGLPKVYCL